MGSSNNERRGRSWDGRATESAEEDPRSKAATPQRAGADPHHPGGGEGGGEGGGCLRLPPLGRQQEEAVESTPRPNLLPALLHLHGSWGPDKPSTCPCKTRLQVRAGFQPRDGDLCPRGQVQQGGEQPGASQDNQHKRHHTPAQAGCSWEGEYQHKAVKTRLKASESNHLLEHNVM